MVAFIVVLEFCLLTGCGADNPTRGPSAIVSSSPWYPYLVLFSEDEEEFERASRVNIGFSDLEEGIVGRCTITYSAFTDLRTIQFDTYNWSLLTANQRLQVVLHELGHCVRELQHDDMMLANGYPASVMHSVIFSVPAASYFADNLDYYREQWRALQSSMFD